MKIASSQTRWLAQESTRKVLRRASTTAAVLAVLAAAIGVPVMSPQPDSGTNPVLAIARADCPPDCGGGPGNGGTPTGPPGGGTEFVPPSIPAMPSYDPGRGQPPLDQNNGISIYNSAAPQPSQAAQPSQAPVQNQDGSYGRAANGEQQPVNYNNAPNNQQINNDWQDLSNQLNQQENESAQQQQPTQNNGQQDQTQNNKQDNQDKDCDAVVDSVRRQFPAELFEDFSQALGRQQEAEKKSGGRPVPLAELGFSPQRLAQMSQYYEALADAMKDTPQCSAPSASGREVGKIQPRSPLAHQGGCDSTIYDCRPVTSCDANDPSCRPPQCLNSIIQNVDIETVQANHPELGGANPFNHRSIIIQHAPLQQFITAGRVGRDVSDMIWEELRCVAQSMPELASYLNKYGLSLFEQLNCHVAFARTKNPFDIEPGRVPGSIIDQVNYHCNTPFAGATP